MSWAARAPGPPAPSAGSERSAAAAAPGPREAARAASAEGVAAQGAHDIAGTRGVGVMFISVSSAAVPHALLGLELRGKRAGKFNVVGGKIDTKTDTSLHCAVLRETREEVGGAFVDAFDDGWAPSGDPVRPELYMHGTGVFVRVVPWCVTQYLLQPEEPEPEIGELAWFPLDTLGGGHGDCIVTDLVGTERLCTSYSVGLARRVVALLEATGVGGASDETAGPPSPRVGALSAAADTPEARARIRPPSSPSEGTLDALMADAVANARANSGAEEGADSDRGTELAAEAARSACAGQGEVVATVGGATLTVGGDSPWLAEGLARKLRSPSAALEMATPRGLLPPALRSLAQHVEPEQFIVDFGGMGACGPNTLAGLLGLAKLFDGSGQDCRALIVKHASSQEVRARPTPFRWRDTNVALTIGELMQESMVGWPEAMRAGIEASADGWCELVGLAAAWTDTAFVLVGADLFQVCFALSGVNDLGEISRMIVLEPARKVRPRAWLEIGCWIGRHFVGIVRAEPGSVPAAPAGGGVAQSPSRSQDPTFEVELKEYASFTWPLTSLNELKRLLACEYIRPNVLVGMEFSGAMRNALGQRGWRVLSCDWRPSELGGMHYIGDVRDVVEAQVWELVWLFPPCFQQLRADTTLPYKLTDGRAWWGCAFVLWCVCASMALAVAVEQPDTIVADLFDAAAWPGTEMLEFTTDQFAGNDGSRKFVRITSRNLSFEPPPGTRSGREEDPSRTHRAFRDAEARDRARSSWAPYPGMCEALASTRRTSEERPPRLDYVTVIRAFAQAWEAAGYALPAGFDRSDARPEHREDRVYQTKRGAGDGRTLSGVPADWGGHGALPTEEAHEWANGQWHCNRAAERQAELVSYLVEGARLDADVDFLADHRPEFTAWIAARGLTAAGEAASSATPAPAAEGPRGRAPANSPSHAASKWPKESKPTVEEAMRAIAVLRRAAEVLSEPIYIFGDDAKDYFNQLAMATSELWKLNVVFLAEADDLEGVEAGDLVFISEMRLGFGTHGASNIAQRFSDALLAIFRDGMDEAEQAAAGNPSPPMRGWLATRRTVLEPGEAPTHHTRRWRAPNDTAGSIEVRPQQRLYSALMYTVRPICRHCRALPALLSTRPQHS